MRHTFTHTLGPDDAKRHIEHAFRLDTPASELKITLRHTDGTQVVRGHGLANMLTLTVFDPNGLRGEGHRMGTRVAGARVHEVVLNETSATLGYAAGSLPQGAWRVIINTHRITGAAPCDYTLTIEAAPQAHNGGGRWLRGDFHAHTAHSDGHWHAEDLIAHALERKLDFQALTDHNTLAGVASFAQASAGRIISLGGLELTTFYGHAVALGIQHAVSWHLRPGYDMRGAAEATRNAGGLFIIAHPHAPGDPFCTGCDWTYADLMPGAAPAVEVWNGEWHEEDGQNEKGLQLYYGWLNQGHRLIATAGTDIHGPYLAGQKPGFNVVYARSSDADGILTAARAGHLFLSSGPQLEVTAHGADGGTAMMGDVLSGALKQLDAHWRDVAAGRTLRVIADGVVAHEQTVAESGALNWQDDGHAARWVTLEIRAADGTLEALSNPVFAGA